MKWTVVFGLLIIVLVLNVNARRGRHRSRAQRRRPKPNSCMGVSNCAKCARNGKCSRCSPGFFLLRSAKPNGPAKCVASCPEGFVSRNPWAPYCEEEGCSGPYCRRCKAGWYRVSESHKKCHRTCPAGTVPTGGVCSNCQNHCQKCNSRRICAACEDGYFLVNVLRHCRNKCPPGTKEEVNPLGGVRCRRACKVENCESCHWFHRSVCFKCKADFYKLPSDFYYPDVCLSQCPDRYYDTPTSNGGKECIEGTPEPMTSPEPTTESEPTTEPETTTGCDMRPWGNSPEPTTEYEPTTTPKPITEPESSTTTSDPATEPEVTSSSPTSDDWGDWP